MRVLVAADAMAGLNPRAASEVIASAFADRGAEVAVVPLADGGTWFADALRDFDPGAAVARPASVAEVLDALSASARYLDLTGLPPCSWDELVSVSPAAVRNPGRAGGVVAVVRSGTESAPLTGLSGVVAERGRAEGTDLAATLAADSRVADWCRALGVPGDAPGAGAAAGVGALMLAVGASITSGVQACIKGFDMAGTVARADLCVTGAPVLDFHAVGGEVVKQVTKVGGDALRPVIAVVGRNFVSSRELRLAGLESAHPILTGPGDDEPTPEQLARVAAGVARSWVW